LEKHDTLNPHTIFGADSQHEILTCVAVCHKPIIFPHEALILHTLYKECINKNNHLLCVVHLLCINQMNTISIPTNAQWYFDVINLHQNQNNVHLWVLIL